MNDKGNETRFVGDIMKNDMLCREPRDKDNIGAIIIFAAFFIMSYWMQDFILSISTQILMIAVIIFVLHHAQSKTKEISQWIQPSIYSIPPANIPNIVFWNIFAISPLFNRYKSEFKKRCKLENQVQDSKNEINKISGIINDLNDKKSRCKADNPEESLSLASKTEINILSEKISNQTKKKNKKMEECLKLEISIENKGHTLNKLKEDARVIVITKSKKSYNEKYEKEVKSEEEKKKRRKNRKEKEKNDIKKLVREIEELINYNKLNTTDDAIINELAIIEKQIKRIAESFESDNLPYIDTMTEIKNLRNDINKIITL